MVDDNTLGLAARKHMIHLIQSASAAEIHAAYQISLIKSLLHLLRMLVVSHDIITARQPGKGIRYHIRHTDDRALTQRAQKISPSQR